MFQFTDLPLSYMWSTHIGFPIRRSWHQRLCAPPPSFSQLITSFIGFCCLGILRVPLIAFYSNSNSFPVFIVIFLPTIHFPLSLINIGGDKRVRTADLCLARAALSQLSYIPIKRLLRHHSWWAWLDSNQWPLRYQHSALTTWATRPQT